ncbi:ribbon-helix-helix protein, CopG family [Pseudonocardia nematodicida]|uniref:Ribbon-helix-helix protein, CopG family n=1 Tax=Pseudonocardia nematodicida TaxID=1206997 RepID=A0ABV1K803_9PSEU
MAMNVRFSDEETEQLRDRARAEGRSMGEVTRAAVREYLQRHGHQDRVAEVLADLAPRRSELLRRLGEA